MSGNGTRNANLPRATVFVVDADTVRHGGSFFKRVVLCRECGIEPFCGNAKKDGTGFCHNGRRSM